MRPRTSVTNDAISIDDLWAAIEDAGPLTADDPSFDEAILATSSDSERLLAQTDRRRSFIAAFAWAVPARAAVDAIATFAGQRRILEICAGNGLWARLIGAAGGDILASDAADYSRRSFVAVELRHAEAAVRAHPERRALLACWPPMRDSCAFRALTAFRGDRFMLAGDLRFTGDAQFHALLSRDWSPESEVLLPSWPGLDDRLRLYRRSAAD